MKDYLIKQLSRFFYPQYIFGKEIYNFIKEQKGIKLIIDAPCGNGETTYHISRYSSALVYGYDISNEAICIAKKYFTRKNLTFEVSDVFSVFQKHKNIDVFCLINSLFLLPNQDDLLKQIYNSLSKDGFLILILPNIESINYKKFINDESNKKINTLTLSKSEFNHFFSKYGFEIIRIKPIVYAHLYGRKDIKFLSVFSHLYLILLNFIQTFLKIGTPSYFLLVAKKF